MEIHGARPHRPSHEDLPQMNAAWTGEKINAPTSCSRKLCARLGSLRVHGSTHGSRLSARWLPCACALPDSAAWSLGHHRPTPARRHVASPVVVQLPPPTVRHTQGQWIEQLRFNSINLSTNSIKPAASEFHLHYQAILLCLLLHNREQQAKLILPFQAIIRDP